MGSWRVLLVDPIVDDRELQAHVLRSAGLDVIEPSDNPIKDAITRRPDAVVVDASPQRHGSRELVQALKQDPRTTTIPVVVISGTLEASFRQLKDSSASLAPPTRSSRRSCAW